MFYPRTLRASPARAGLLSDAAHRIIKQLGLTRVEVSVSPYTGMPAIVSNFAVVI